MSSMDSVHLVSLSVPDDDSSFFLDPTTNSVDNPVDPSTQPQQEDRLATSDTTSQTYRDPPLNTNPVSPSLPIPINDANLSSNQHLHQRHTLENGEARNGHFPSVQEDDLDSYNSVREQGQNDKFHCHQPRPGMNKLARNQLIAVSILCVLFMVGEIIGGTLAGSLALITDATHLASDLAGFLVSLFAIWIAGHPPTVRLSFGYYRAEVLGALVSVLIIWITTGVLVYLAVQRVIHQKFHIDADSMLITSAAGVAFNIIMGMVLNCSRCGCDAVAHAHGGHGHSHGGHGHSQGGHGHSHEGHGHSNGNHNNSYRRDSYISNGDALNYDHDDKEIVENNNVSSHETCVDMSNIVHEVDEVRTVEKPETNINIKAAFIHVIGDLIQSIGVFLAAIVIKVRPDFKLADPICTFIFSVLVLFTTITILRDALLLLMEAVPRNLDYRMCKFDLETLEGVRAVHSLHIWSLSMDKNVVSVHLVALPDADRRRTLKESILLLRKKYKAFNTTIQIEDYEEEVMLTCEDCAGPKLS